MFLSQIKLKYFSIPKHGQDSFVCFQCKHKSDKISSVNTNRNLQDMNHKSFAFYLDMYYTYWVVSRKSF